MPDTSFNSMSLSPMKYILVTGGVISGIGKGIISSSIGTILRSHGYRVTSIKVFAKFSIFPRQIIDCI